MNYEVIGAFMQAIEKNNMDAILKIFLDNYQSLMGTAAFEKVLIGFFNYNSKCSDVLSILLDFGLDIQFKNDYGHNLLSILIGNCNFWCGKDLVKVAKFLINAGVSVNEPDKTDCTPLEHALYKGINVELVKLLLKEGATASLPLHILIHSNSYSNTITKRVIQLFLSHGAEINAKNENGQTPLHEACLKHLDGIITFLFHEGADINVEDKTGKIALALLNPEVHHNYLLSLVEMIKEIAFLKFFNKDVSEKNMSIINKNPVAVKHLKNCYIQLSNMKRTLFYENFSLLNILALKTKIKKLANLTRNENFLSALETRLFKEKKDNFEMIYYHFDLVHLFYEAAEFRNNLITVYSRLESIFKKVFPDLITRKLANYLDVADLPLK